MQFQSTSIQFHGEAKRTQKSLPSSPLRHIHLPLPFAFITFHTIHTNSSSLSPCRYDDGPPGRTKTHIRFRFVKPPRANLGHRLPKRTTMSGITRVSAVLAKNAQKLVRCLGLGVIFGQCFCAFVFLLGLDLASYVTDRFLSLVG